MARLLRGIRRIASRSPEELRERGVQKLSAIGERALTRLSPMSGPGRHGGSIDIGAFMPAAIDFPASAALADAGERRRVLDIAERIDAGSVPLLGLGWVELGQEPDWHREPIAGIRAPFAHWSTIPFLERDVVGDHKILWEFNRHQHLVVLGQAWRLSRDARWEACAVRHVEGWLAQNPPRLGVNWASSLEVAYRAISWCWTIALFADSPTFMARVGSEMLFSLDFHGRHVARYLSTYFSPNTHLTGEALGLLYLGVALPSLPTSARFRETGARILREQLSRQVHPDGVYFEQASQYHRYTTEIYLHTLLLLEASGSRDTREIRAGVHRLFDVLAALTRADGTIPLVGDDDGGRLVQLDGEGPHGVRNLLNVGAVVLDRPDLAALAGRDPAATVMTAWMLGAEGARRLGALHAHTAERPSSRAFVDGGIYVMRDHQGDGHAVIDGGPHGALSFGHSHADALAVELWAGGGPLLVDAGTLTYVGEERDAFRCTSAHNVVEVDGESSSLPGAPFKWRLATDAVTDGWCADGTFAWYAGHHDGYRRLATPVSYSRMVVHPADGLWLVEDTLSSERDHAVVLPWLLSPEVAALAPVRKDDLTAISLGRDGAVVASLVLHAPGGSVAVVPAEVSPQFGKRVPSHRVRWNGRFQRDLRALSIVVDWTVCRAGSVTIRTANGTELELSAPDRRVTGRLEVWLDLAPPGLPFGLPGNPTMVVRESDGSDARRIVCLERPVTSGADGTGSAGRWHIAERSNETWNLNAGTLSPVRR